MDDCTSPMDVSITISSETPIGVEALSIKLPSAYVHGKRNAETDVWFGEQVDVNPDLSRTYSIQLPRLPWYYGLLPISFHKSLTAFAHVEYKDAVTGRIGTAEEPFDLPVEAPTSAIFIGGVLGVILWVLLAWGLKTPMSTRGTLVGVAITLFVLACARFTAANLIPLPITIDLKDSFAGLLVGIMWPTAQKTVLSKVFPTLS